MPQVSDKKQVWLEIRSSQQLGRQQEQDLLKVDGCYYLKAQTAHLLYREEGGQITHLRIQPDLVHIHRLGSLAGDLWFKLGDTRETRYDTPMGALLITVQTHEMSWLPGRQLYLHYALLSEGQLLSENQLTITIRERKSNEQSCE